MGLKKSCGPQCPPATSAGQVAAEAANILETSGAFNGNIKKERFPGLVWLGVKNFFLF